MTCNLIAVAIKANKNRFRKSKRRATREGEHKRVRPVWLLTKQDPNKNAIEKEDGDDVNEDYDSFEEEFWLWMRIMKMITRMNAIDGDSDEFWLLYTCINILNM